MDNQTARPPRFGFSDFMLKTVAGLMFREIDGIGFWQSPMLDKTGLVRHGFTTRKGGVSRGTYGSMNLSISRTGSVKDTKRNYELATRALGIDISDTVLVDGVHGVNVKRVYAKNKGDGLVRPYDEGGDNFDGMVTDVPGVALVTIHADCAPLFLVDPVHRAIGLCHAGWRGTVGGMGQRIVQAMRREFLTEPEDLLCMIGPHIGACCFEVHDDVAEQFLRVFAGFGGIRAADTPGKSYVDLTLAMAYQLFEAGIPARHVNIAHLCTCCNKTMFHSYRRDGMRGGAMASFLQVVSR